ncbi:disease resistance protein RPV1 isoform X2 [Daucus carota subsp. sativus]|uniref:disease resistance protein RPV1 isoform X2 n=1 Tax=Daucus carota subsp. sativus TaxID=79200 RepID=UPI0007EFB61E|nr:PREDICTED: TMV resistance protein N-like isoform X2 [Daucus carota subsp. sativus]
MMASTSWSQTPSSSVSTSNSPRWDAFLNFRGLDTRYSFTGHLYGALTRAGIHTFIDEHELHGGDRLSRALPQAIRESKSYIVVFSENYASSVWCLDELVEILDRQKTFGRIVIPVFFKIEPCVVRYQEGRFQEDFRDHEIYFADDPDKVGKWRRTLSEVADCKGIQISAKRSEAESVTEIVNRILSVTNPRKLYVAKYPVGLDSHVEGITDIISSSGVSETTSPRKIGIYGMGGVGKSTIAKAVYNRNYSHFQGSCFLADVRLALRKEKGLKRLQQQLIHDVLERQNIIMDNVDRRIEFVRARISSTKVLVVIDDLNDLTQLESLGLGGPFALGSVLIITTRNEDLLDKIHVEAKYKVNELDDAASYQLFTKLAFKDDMIISDTFADLSKEIIECAGGLPLALGYMGWRLLNQEEDGWRSYMSTLEKSSISDVHENIHDNLLISFDALEALYPKTNLSDMFLDIACFFVGLEEEKVVKIMETCYEFVKHKIGLLRKTCLLTTNSGDKLGMHRLHMDMGREIVRKISPHEPGKRSRLWVLQDICEVLKTNKGTEAIEGIIPHNLCYKDALEGVSFDMETFKRMSRLRFLYLDKVSLTGCFEQTFEVLTLLHWKCFPLESLPPEFRPQNLVVLELPHSKIKTMWMPNMDTQVFQKLKTLNMSHSLDLTTTPDFNRLQCLETLNLEGCKRLEEVDKSIGCLKGLVSLNMRHCVNLKSLPSDIRNLTSLKNFELADCHQLLSITDLPPNLKWLWAGRCESVNKLPNLSNLKQLEILELTNCSGLTTIHGLEELTSIQRLHVEGCNSSLLASNFTQEILWIWASSHDIHCFDRASRLD